MALIREREDGTHKVSLRSRGEVDVEKIARHHGGGGHRNAAGFTLEGDGEAVRRQVAAELGAALGWQGMTEMKDGLLLIDKEPGFTSHDVVQRVRRILKQKKIGHCGTLDPDATGLLLLTLGNGHPADPLPHPRAQGLRGGRSASASRPTPTTPRAR